MHTWYAVRTKVHGEERAVWHLRNQGFETYLPRYAKQVRHARKVSAVLRPLFPGYIFVGVDLEKQRWRAINNTIGVISLVQLGDKPTPVKSAVIDGIRAQEGENGLISLTPNGLQKGDSVRLRDGAFTDCIALLEEISDEKRAILLLNLMGREVRVTAPLNYLAAAS